ncbi:pyridoxal phosphate-dependent aminotransferase, partial [Embleya sp. NPDC059213]|uniref:pyridoxal phosphate-dependent aminotransferase n=1 Tax=Embleya sp. NPDC059213 TaxID=3346771 RepID=UPI0036B50A4B
PLSEEVNAAGLINLELNQLPASLEPGREVVLADPIYAGLINRVRLVGGVPRFVRCTAGPAGWSTDPEELAAAVGPNTAAVLVTAPVMPTGALLDHTHWDALARAVAEHDCWVIYDAAMERIRFDGTAPDHPAAHPGLAHRTITCGAASKELRMIGWRVGWVAGPAEIMADVKLVGLSNVVCPVGIGQAAVAAALSAPDADADVAAATAIWRDRCATILDALADYPCIRPHGGWSLLIDTAAMGLAPESAAERLFRLGRIAATPMHGWGPQGSTHLRLVFANEPVRRLSDIRTRFEAAFG